MLWPPWVLNTICLAHHDFSSINMPLHPPTHLPSATSFSCPTWTSPPESAFPSQTNNPPPPLPRAVPLYSTHFAPPPTHTHRHPLSLPLSSMSFIFFFFSFLFSLLFPHPYPPTHTHRSKTTLCYPSFHLSTHHSPSAIHFMLFFFFAFSKPTHYCYKTKKKRKKPNQTSQYFAGAFFLVHPSILKKIDWIHPYTFISFYGDCCAEARGQLVVELKNECIVLFTLWSDCIEYWCVLIYCTICWVGICCVGVVKHEKGNLQRDLIEN